MEDGLMSLGLDHMPLVETCTTISTPRILKMRRFGAGYV